MANNNHYQLKEIVKGDGYEEIRLRYIRDPADPYFDDLPSEQLRPGEHYNITFVPLNPETEYEFNKKSP